MRTYKFRGKRFDNGELIYGDLSISSRPAIGNGRDWFLVEPESVAQFVGFDADGNEIYEGDEIVQPTNIYNRYTAELSAQTVEQGIWRNNFENQVKAYMLVSGDKLKEHKVTLWRGTNLADGTLVTGELQIRVNEFSPDRYDCFICDQKGLHIVDLVSLERVVEK